MSMITQICKDEKFILIIEAITISFQCQRFSLPSTRFCCILYKNSV